MPDALLARARAFIYRQARPLDLARWQFHFENGSQAAVLTALAAYQNADGGFGYALEPDAWNPHSSPLQTWTATEILREIDCTDCSHPMIRGILSYLGSGQAFDGRHWAAVIPSNDAYPHAPWWHSGSQSSSHHDDNPTACLAGFLLRFAEPNSDLDRLGRHIVGEAVAAYRAQGLLRDPHTALCFVRLLEYAREAGAADTFDHAWLADTLHRQVKESISPDTTAWMTGYVCRPSQFIRSRRSPYFPANRDLALAESDAIGRAQEEDGAWAVTWSWDAFPDAWAISKNGWKANGIIQNLLFVKGMEQL